MMIRQDLVSKKFGNLTVQRFSHTKNGQSYWICFCDKCGKLLGPIRGSKLKAGQKTCGCIHAGGKIKYSFEYVKQKINESGFAFHIGNRLLKKI